MTNIPNVIRWNANFVRGLAQSVLERARVIRGSLAAAPAEVNKAKRKRVTTRKARPARRRNAR